MNARPLGVGKRKSVDRLPDRGGRAFHRTVTGRYERESRVAIERSELFGKAEGTDRSVSREFQAREFAEFEPRGALEGAQDRLGHRFSGEFLKSPLESRRSGRVFRVRDLREDHVATAVEPLGGESRKEFSLSVGKRVARTGSKFRGKIVPGSFNFRARYRTRIGSLHEGLFQRRLSNVLENRNGVAFGSANERRASRPHVIRRSRLAFVGVPKRGSSQCKAFRCEREVFECSRPFVVRKPEERFGRGRSRRERLESSLVRERHAPVARTLHESVEKHGALALVKGARGGLKNAATQFVEGELVVSALRGPNSLGSGACGTSDQVRENFRSKVVDVVEKRLIEYEQPRAGRLTEHGRRFRNVGCRVREVAPFFDAADFVGRDADGRHALREVTVRRRTRGHHVAGDAFREVLKDRKRRRRLAKARREGREIGGFRRRRRAGGVAACERRVAS